MGLLCTLYTTILGLIRFRSWCWRKIVKGEKWQITDKNEWDKGTEMKCEKEKGVCFVFGNSTAHYDETHWSVNVSWSVVLVLYRFGKHGSWMYYGIFFSRKCDDLFSVGFFSHRMATLNVRTLLSTNGLKLIHDYMSHPLHKTVWMLSQETFRVHEKGYISIPISYSKLPFPSIKRTDFCKLFCKWLPMSHCATVFKSERILI